MENLLLSKRSKRRSSKDPKKDDEVNSEAYQHQHDEYERIRLENMPLRSC